MAYEFGDIQNVDGIAASTVCFAQYIEFIVIRIKGHVLFS